VKLLAYINIIIRSLFWWTYLEKAFCIWRKRSIESRFQLMLKWRKKQWNILMSFWRWS